MGKARYPVKVDLAKEDYDKLQAIKKHYGLNTDAETMRLAINDAYKIMKQREKILAAAAMEKEKEEE